MGIGRPMGEQDPADFVLKQFSSAEKTQLPAMFDRTAKLIEVLISSGLAAAQNEFHGEGE